MNILRRSRPPAPQDGFTIVEVIVAATITIIVLIAASDLIASTMARSAKIRTQEQARTVAYMVSERARALGCGMVYGSEPDLADRVGGCTQGLAQLGFDPDCPVPTSVSGDASFCVSDGARRYNVEITTGWDFRGPEDVGALYSHDAAKPEVFVRRVVVGTTGIADVTIESREPAPPDRALTAPEPPCVGSSGFTVSLGPASGTVFHSLPVSMAGPYTGDVLYPKPPSGVVSC